LVAGLGVGNTVSKGGDSSAPPWITFLDQLG